jgi:2-oxoglutarate dehydrogenase E2 component (dihydrolipoamide succinyltransferase)
MAIEVKIPAVGESITSGVLTVWHKKSGEFVNEGEPLFTLETDKVSTEIVAEKPGVLETKVPEGQEVQVGQLVAVIDDSKSAPGKPQAGEKTRGPKEEKKAAAEARKPLPPAVRRIVEEEKLKPAEISGTGKGGRLTKGDVLAAAQDWQPAKSEGEVAIPRTMKAESRSSPDLTAVALAKADGRFTRKKMSPLRRKIAAQLVMAQQTAAILTTFNDCDMTAVQALRADAQDGFVKKHGVKLGLMSFFIKAAVEALQAVPPVNGRIEDDDFIQNNFYDIGIAVSTERGLVVPVVRDADKKSFAELERDIAGFATRAREGKLKIEELQGGTFTITNGGVFGSLFATPIINPPQSGILGMHKIMPRPVAIDGKLEVRPMMYLALSYDHRAIDGRESVTFLVKVKECIEDPSKLPLDF